MGIPSFNGIHNQRKAQALFVLQRYNYNYPGGRGLMSREIRELLKVCPVVAWTVCIRLSHWKYVSAALTPRGRKQCLYKISAKGSTWLNKWNLIIPWERYGWTADTIAEMDKVMREIVEFRGYK